jgi:transcriptional regulator with XRE-family HTH domain
MKKSPSQKTKPKIRSLVAENIRYYRSVAKLSQESLGYKAKLADEYISRLENGHVNVGIDNLEKIAKALGIQAYLLFKKPNERGPGETKHTHN